MALEAVLGSLVRLVWQLGVWLRHLRSEAESWRGGPPGYGRLSRATLKGNRAAYDRFRPSYTSDAANEEDR